MFRGLLIRVTLLGPEDSCGLHWNNSTLTVALVMFGLPENGWDFQNQ